MKDSEILWAARERVEQGWCKGAVAPGGKVCALGALGSAAKNNRTFQHLRCELETTLSGQYVPVFNDDPATTKQDVLDLFAKTAIRLEEQGQ